MLDRGDTLDAHVPDHRRFVATALARLVKVGKEIDVPSTLRASHEDGLWPRPHDRRFDFGGTADGAEWIDDIARSARAQMSDITAGESVLGHADWRVEHLRFTGSMLTAAHDWDSLTIDREPVTVGLAAHGFTADWTRDDIDPVPTRNESLAFIDDYEVARGEDFTPPERQIAEAALIYGTAYGARCQYSDLRTNYGQVAASRPINPSAITVGFVAALWSEPR